MACWSVSAVAVYSKDYVVQLFFTEKLRRDPILLVTSNVEIALPPASKYHKIRENSAWADPDSSPMYGM
ncbi:MAG: hypothetical protein ABI076_08990 [Acidobacteriaceae bacterium]